METLLLVNGVGKARRAMMGGREYLVAPLTSIVPGVLPGSKGPLYYPSDEVQSSTKDWDNIPLVVYHPTHNGIHVSAQHPGILDRQGIGFIRKSSFRDKLTHEGWFDAEKTRKVDNRVYHALIHGQRMELSTGLFTENEEAPSGANFKGRTYSHIARGYRPDHIAILPDQVGACSVNDGCGLHVNQRIDNANPEGHNQYSGLSEFQGSAKRAAVRRIDAAASAKAKSPVGEVSVQQISEGPFAGRYHVADSEGKRVGKTVHREKKDAEKEHKKLTGNQRIDNANPFGTAKEYHAWAKKYGSAEERGEAKALLEKEAKGGAAGGGSCSVGQTAARTGCSPAKATGGSSGGDATSTKATSGSGVKGVQSAVPELKHSETIKDKRSGGYRVLMSSERGDARSGNHPITYPGHETATGIAYSVDPESKHVHIDEMTSKIKGAGTRMVDALVSAHPGHTFSTTDLSRRGEGDTSFWDKMRERHSKVFNQRGDNKKGCGNGG